MAVAGLSIALLVAAVWSLIEGRRSGGRVDHRFAVDRLILAVAVAVAANGLLGLLVAAGGAGPREPLHFLYGPAAVIAAPLGWWLVGRPRLDVGAAARRRRDLWVAVAAIVLLALQLRLVGTG